MANPDILEQTRSAYNAVAESYATVLPDVTFEAPLDLALVEEFTALICSTPERRVIDAGCGAGRMSAHLTGSGVRVTGVDLSPEMVRVARERHPKLAFEVGELSGLPAADGAADGVLAWYSIIRSSPADLPRIAREFWRVLRPGGWALLAFQAGSGHRAITRAYGHDVELTAELHLPDDVATRFADQRFTLEAQLVRAPWASEKHPQAVLLLKKSSLPEPGTTAS